MSATEAIDPEPADALERELPSEDPGVRRFERAVRLWHDCGWAGLYWQSESDAAFSAHMTRCQG